MEVPVYFLSRLAEGKSAIHGVPSDFMERVKTWDGSVSLGAGWEAIHEAFSERSCYVPAEGSDYLYLDDDSETDGLEALATLTTSDDEGVREGVPDAIEALKCMAAQRQGLGLDAVQWVLG